MPETKAGGGLLDLVGEMRFLKWFRSLMYQAGGRKVFVGALFLLAIREIMFAPLIEPVVRATGSAALGFLGAVLVVAMAIDDAAKARAAAAFPPATEAGKPEEESPSGGDE